ncbi:MAG: AMP-binding protein [Planctomycetota bacterium]
MPQAHATIAEMFDRTLARRGNDPAIGRIADGELTWQTWAEFAACPGRLLDMIRQGDAGSHKLVPTSGTGGTPKTACITQQNLVFTTLAVAKAITESLGDEDDRDEVRLSILPFEHLYARVCDLYAWVYRGTRLVLPESRETVFRDCKIARPTTINGVPYFFQKAVDVAERRGEPLREVLGGAIKRCYCGGAALSPALQRHYFDQGVPLLNGYGLTEASPVVTVSTIADYKIGTVGKPLPGVEVRIAGPSSETPGEVLVRGPNVMLGYADESGAIDRTATDEAIRDGWLHTGDLGELDGDGFLTITGRKKELMVLSTGKNVAPAAIEARLGASPWIEQACVVGDGRKFLSAILVPNPDRVRAEVRGRRLWVFSKRHALRHPVVRGVFRQEIDRCLADLPRHEQVKAFTILPRAFSAERGEITPKLSLRRPVIEASFRREIERMYQAAAPQLTT